MQFISYSNFVKLQASPSHPPPTFKRTNSSSSRGGSKFDLDAGASPFFFPRALWYLRTTLLNPGCYAAVLGISILLDSPEVFPSASYIVDPFNAFARHYAFRLAGLMCDIVKEDLLPLCKLGVSQTPSTQMQ